MKTLIKTTSWQALMILGFTICFSTVTSAQTNDQIQQYIETYKPIAEAEMIRTGVPAAISLAQGIVESQAGTGWLAINANNQFGIKCKPVWIGPTVLHNDDAPNECFRAYGTPDSSWRDHSDFLRSSPRYAFLFDLNPLNYKEWARGLKSAGYATSPTYAQALINTIQTWNLEQYSEQAFAQMENNPQNAFAAMLDKKVKEDRRGWGIFRRKKEKEQTFTRETAIGSDYPEGVFRINGKEVMYLPNGTQLISVAEKYHIRLSRLVRFNELNSDVIDKNMLIYLQKKKKTGAHKTHLVKEGETLHQIAQEEGIRMKWLLKRNRIHGNDAIQPGEILYLTGYARQENQYMANKDTVHSQNGNTEWKQKLSNLLNQQNRNVSSVDTVDSSEEPTVARSFHQPEKPSSQSTITYE
ncbi:MAG: glucosaminidase domain-containing protein, partial [Chitinophagaceae bacterium]